MMVISSSLYKTQGTLIELTRGSDHRLKLLAGNKTLGINTNSRKLNVLKLLRACASKANKTDH